VFVGSALKYIGVQRLLDGVLAYLPSPPDYIGVQRLLDGVLAYLPSPLDRPVLIGHKPSDKEKEIAVECDPKGGLVALVFKITSDAHGDLNFLRIYQGTLKSGSRVLNENITRIFEMHAKERRILDSASAGDIVAVVGLKQTLTGDTVCDPKKPVMLPSISFPQTVINMSIEPRTTAEKAKLVDALADLKREDPTFECQACQGEGCERARGQASCCLQRSH